MGETCQCGKAATTFFGIPATVDTPSSHMIVCDDHKQSLFSDWNNHLGRSRNMPVIDIVGGATHCRWVDKAGA